MTAAPLTDEELERGHRLWVGAMVFVLLPATFVLLSLQAGQSWPRAILAGVVVGLWADLIFIVIGHHRGLKARQATDVVHTTTDAIYPGTDRPIQIGDRVWGPDGYVSIVRDLAVITQAEDVAHGVQSLWLRRNQVTYAGPAKGRQS